MKRFFCVSVFLIILLCSCAAAEDVELMNRYDLAPSGEAVINDVRFYGDSGVNDLNRVFYEIFVGSFSDSDGDGVGDLRGVINRMDYLNDGDPV